MSAPLHQAKTPGVLRAPATPMGGTEAELHQLPVALTDQGAPEGKASTWLRVMEPASSPSDGSSGKGIVQDP